MGLIDRLGLRRKRVERGSAGTVYFPPDGGYRNNWWQLGTVPSTTSKALASSAVYSCVSVIAQEVSRLKVHHWRDEANGGRVKITTSPAARVMRRPNSYETSSDFWLNLIAATATNGNGYAVAERDAVGRIVSLHRVPSTGTRPQVDPETGAVFYDIPQQKVAPQLGSQVPARDVAHLKLFTGNDPLIGISPLEAASYSMAHGEQIQRQAVAFWGARATPAGILSTDRPLSAEAARRIRDQWQNANSSDNVGKTAVLDSGMSWTPLSLTNHDSQMIDSFNMTTETIAAIYRVPLFMINRLPTVSFNSVETMNRTFYSSTLATWIEAAEGVLDKLFSVPAGEAIEFDVEKGLMQTNFDTRIKAYKDAIQGGVYSVNECRELERLPRVEGGDTIFLQSQMQPIEALNSPAEPAPVGEPSMPAPEDDGDDPDAERIAELTRELARQRLEFAHERGSLEQDLALARARAEGEA